MQVLFFLFLAPFSILGYHPIGERLQRLHSLLKAKQAGKGLGEGGESGGGFGGEKFKREDILGPTTEDDDIIKFIQDPSGQWIPAVVDKEFEEFNDEREMTMINSMLENQLSKATLNIGDSIMLFVYQDLDKIMSSHLDMNQIVTFTLTSTETPVTSTAGSRDPGTPETIPAGSRNLRAPETTTAGSRDPGAPVTSTARSSGRAQAGGQKTQRLPTDLASSESSLSGAILTRPGSSTVFSNSRLRTVRPTAKERVEREDQQEDQQTKREISSALEEWGNRYFRSQNNKENIHFLENSLELSKESDLVLPTLNILGLELEMNQSLERILKLSKHKIEEEIKHAVIFQDLLLQSQKNSQINEGDDSPGLDLNSEEINLQGLEFSRIPSARLAGNTPLNSDRTADGGSRPSLKILRQLSQKSTSHPRQPNHPAQLDTRPSQPDNPAQLPQPQPVPSTASPALPAGQPAQLAKSSRPGPLVPRGLAPFSESELSMSEDPSPSFLPPRFSSGSRIEDLLRSPDWIQERRWS